MTSGFRSFPRALGDAVQIDREIGGEAVGDRHEELFHLAVVDAEKLGSNDADAVGTDSDGVFRKFYRVFRSRGAYVDEHRYLAGGLFDDGLGNEFPFLHRHLEHLSGGTARIQAVDSVADKIVGELLQSLNINFVVRRKGRHHRRNHTIHSFHTVLPSFL